MKERSGGEPGGGGCEHTGVGIMYQSDKIWLYLVSIAMHVGVSLGSPVGHIRLTIFLKLFKGLKRMKMKKRDIYIFGDSHFSFLTGKKC